MALPTPRFLQKTRDSFSINGFLDRSTQSLAFSTPLTIDASAGDVVSIGVLTNNITINAPTNPYFGVQSGQELILVFTQDGTGGRTVTWNVVFRVNWQPSLLPNARNTITFIYDGTAWNQVSAATGL